MLPPSSKANLTQVGLPYDVGFTISRLGLTTTQLTYLAITSRSYHSDGSNAALADGSVRFFNETIAPTSGRRSRHEAVAKLPVPTRSRPQTSVM